MGVCVCVCVCVCVVVCVWEGSEIQKLLTDSLWSRCLITNSLPLPQPQGVCVCVCVCVGGIRNTEVTNRVIVEQMFDHKLSTSPSTSRCVCVCVCVCV